ncbi:hypothetical protein JN11_04527 [Mucilaginibacter frigoritolerans]|jgi:hypothetical protein|uniref:Copper chaperone CopZ n=1 Tax=Mucilaginibacter frigoritolerans TaxID=652788 RepID=A0A562TPB7_9SPHI|nr:hypothetical protein [Mucilaginibacter frigoritolerans]TWI95098.1 hypothetical protein JN11_04527 [Mucilaginibacter frigoritolerans]
MIEVFKTNVENSKQAAALLYLLQDQLPSAEINFDLEDCDNILRVKGNYFCPSNIIQTLADYGFECSVLVQ